MAEFLGGSRASLERLASLGGLRIDADALARLSSEQQEQVRDQLALVERALRENPLLGFRPHGKQVVFMGPPHPRARLFLGGNRSGKTTSGMGYGTIQCLPPELVPDHLRLFKRWGWDGPCFGRVVTPDLTTTMEGVVLQKLRDWCPPAALKGGSVDRAFDKVQRMLRFKNGSWIQFMSNDQDLDKFGGTALHWCLFDEEPRQDVYSECLMRLIDYGGEMLFTMTPLQGMSWVYGEFFEPWENGLLNDEDVRVVVVDMDDNPHLSEEGKRVALQGLSSEERAARKSGRFVSFSGLIYPQASDAVVPQLDRLPPGVEVFRGIDPGYRHMCAVLYCFLDADDELVVFDEVALKGATVKQACDEMRRRDLRWGVEQDDGTVLPLRVNWSVIDPASRNKNNQTGRSDQQEFADHGIYTIPGQNAVTPGINRVKERLEAGKLRVAANCSELIAEFKRYRWVKDSGRSEDDARERPVKKDDHLLDALRYVVMQRPLAPRRERPVEELSEKDRRLRAHFERVKRHGTRRYANSGMGPGQFS